MATLSVRPVGGGDGDWFDLPEPNADGGYSIGIQDVDSHTTGRDANGYLHRDRVAIKRKLNCSWSNRSPAVIQSILNSAIKNVFFECKYLDPQTGAYEVKTFYCGDASVPWYSQTIYSLTRNFIER